MRRLIPLFASLALTALAPAQECATLTITGNGAPGTDLTFELTDAPSGTVAFLVFGKTAGSTSLGFGPLGTLDLGLAAPFIPVPMGLTDDGGAASSTIPVPAGFDHAVLDLLVQGLTAELKISMAMGTGWPSLSLDFCTSNVAGFQIGN